MNQQGFVSLKAPYNPEVGSVRLQRKCACEASGETCSRCAANKGKGTTPISNKKSGLQRKLAIGASNDPLELEADRVADQVMTASGHTAVSGASPRIQRYAGQATGQTDTAPASVDRVLASSGRPLERALRQDMGQRFGYDFSQVRVHSGVAAEQSAAEVKAKAYTVGHNVVFGAGQFEPGTHEGHRLIAHELTHVVQQSRGGTSPPALRGGMLEQAADAAASAFVADRGPIYVGEASAPGLARQPLSGSPVLNVDKPRSLMGSLDTKTLTDEELMQEIDLILEWLNINPTQSFERTHISLELEYLQAEESRRKERRKTEGQRQAEPKEGSIAKLVSIAHQGLVEVKDEARDFDQAKRMFELTGQFIFLHRFAPIEIRSGQRISRAERYRDLGHTVQQRGAGDGPQSVGAERFDPVRERLTDPELKLHQATQKFNYLGVDLKNVSPTFQKPPVNLLGGRALGYYRILEQLDDNQLYETSEDSLKRLLPSVTSSQGPVTIGTPYVDEKEKVLVIRYPIEMQLETNETKTFVFEIWWFADEKNEFNFLVGHAEGAALHANATPEMWQLLPIEESLNRQLGILLRPIVGDRILFYQMKRELIGMVASGVSTHLAQKGAQKMLGLLPGGGPNQAGPSQKQPAPGVTSSTLTPNVTPPKVTAPAKPPTATTTVPTVTPPTVSPKVRPPPATTTPKPKPTNPQVEPRAANDNVPTDIERARQKRATPPQRQTQMAEKPLAATGTGDVAPAKVVESSAQQQTSNKPVAMTGGKLPKPPETKPVSGSVRVEDKGGQTSDKPVTGSTQPSPDVKQATAGKSPPGVEPSRQNPEELDPGKGAAAGRKQATASKAPQAGQITADNLHEVPGMNAFLKRFEKFGRPWNKLNFKSLDDLVAFVNKDPAKAVKELNRLMDIKEVYAEKVGSAKKNPDVPHQITEAERKWFRKEVLGGTPGKNSKTGKAVQARMRKEEKLKGDPGKEEFLDSRTKKWYPVNSSECDMGHTIDAVKWWNTKGKFYAAKSKEVLDWMKYEKNYELEYGPENSKAGAKLLDEYEGPHPDPIDTSKWPNPPSPDD